MKNRAFVKISILSSLLLKFLKDNISFNKIVEENAEVQEQKQSIENKKNAQYNDGQIIPLHEDELELIRLQFKSVGLLSHYEKLVAELDLVLDLCDKLPDLIKRKDVNQFRELFQNILSYEWFDAQDELFDMINISEDDNSEYNYQLMDLALLSGEKEIIKLLAENSGCFEIEPKEDEFIPKEISNSIRKKLENDPEFKKYLITLKKEVDQKNLVTDEITEELKNVYNQIIANKNIIPVLLPHGIYQEKTLFLLGQNVITLYYGIECEQSFSKDSIVQVGKDFVAMINCKPPITTDKKTVNEFILFEEKRISKFNCKKNSFSKLKNYYLFFNKKTDNESCNKRLNYDLIFGDHINHIIIIIITLKKLDPIKYINYPSTREQILKSAYANLFGRVCHDIGIENDKLLNFSAFIQYITNNRAFPLRKIIYQNGKLTFKNFRDSFERDVYYLDQLIDERLSNSKLIIQDEIDLKNLTKNIIDECYNDFKCISKEQKESLYEYYAINKNLNNTSIMSYMSF